MPYNPQRRGTGSGAEAAHTCADSSSPDVSPQPKQTSLQKTRAEVAKRRREDFDAALADGSLRIRYMNERERKSGIVRLRARPKRRKP